MHAHAIVGKRVIHNGVVVWILQRRVVFSLDLLRRVHNMGINLDRMWIVGNTIEIKGPSNVHSGTESLKRSMVLACGKGGCQEQGQVETHLAGARVVIVAVVASADCGCESVRLFHLDPAQPVVLLSRGR